MKKPNIRVRVNAASVAAKPQAPAASAQPALNCADAGMDAELLEFAMDLKSPGRTLLAERFERWAKQLKDSVAVMNGLRIGEANPNN